MASNREGPTPESSGPVQDGEPLTQVRLVKIQANLHPQTSSAVILKSNADSPIITPSGPILQLSPSTGTHLTSLQKAVTPAGATSIIQQGFKKTLSFMASGTQATPPARTLVISVPKAAASAQPVASKAVPTSVLIPPGMMLIRSDSGQLMLVSQQALAQVQQAPRIVSAASILKSKDKVTVFRMTTTPPLQAAAAQKAAEAVIAEPPRAGTEQHSPPPILGAGTPTTKEAAATFSQVVGATKATRAEPPRAEPPRAEPPRAEPPRAGTEKQSPSTKESSPTISPETRESVNKCKNFLVTLVKLASSGPGSTTMAHSVKELVRALLEGEMEAEEFTEQLYCELKSTPQPCLVPFLKKSLCEVRRLISDPQLFLQQALSGAKRKAPFSSTDRGQPTKTSLQGAEPLLGGSLRAPLTSLGQSRSLIKMGAPPPGIRYTGRESTGGFPMKQPFIRHPPNTNRSAFNERSGTYKEEDDINDVASMAGVNLREENARILTSGVGSVVQSCQDQLFLSAPLLLSRILQTGQRLGVADVGAEVAALVSHATQQHLRGLLEKATLVATHRKGVLKEDHTKVNDVRAQFRFLEEVENLKKKKQDQVEREKLLRLARSRPHREDPVFQQLRQKAKELQLIEEAHLQQREANIAALAAIGPRKKVPLDHTQGPLLPRQAVPMVTRVMLRDLLLCMEQDPKLRHSLTFYRSML